MTQAPRQTPPSAPTTPEAPRRQNVGFLSLPPYRIQGISIAGEETVIQVPELDTCFDIGRAPGFALTSKYIALSHGHMDHSAGIAYYFSQRVFQGMSPGTVVCHPDLEKPIHSVMRGWIDLEAQKTPYNVTPLAPDGEIEIKHNTYLRAFAVEHRVPALGYVILERRSKLKPELVGMPQEKLMELKAAGQPITQMLEVPLICYTGDTMWGKHFERPDVLNAKILITECTFLEPGHRSRAAIGLHLHLDDIVELVKLSTAEAIILTHLSRRTHMGEAKRQIEAALPPEHRARVHLLMDNRSRMPRERENTDERKPPGEGKAETA